VAREEGNRRRKRIHKLAPAVVTRRIRLVAEATNGSPYAEVIEMRVYE